MPRRTLQKIICQIGLHKTGASWNQGLNARLDVHARGIWDRQGSAFFRREGLSPKHRVLQRSHHSADLSQTWMWEEEVVCEQGFGSWARDFHTLSLHCYQRHGGQMQTFPQYISGTHLYYERREVQHNNFMDMFKCVPGSTKVRFTLPKRWTHH